MISAILAALQTFFNYQGLGEKHRIAANKYSALVRELEMHLMIPLEDSEVAKFIDDWRIRYDAVQVESPSVPEMIWRSALKKQ